MTENITVNTHSSIRIAAEKILYIDPFRVENEPHDGDIVFITHSHFDHFSPEDIAKIARPGTVFVMPESMKQDAADAGLENIVTMKPGEKTVIEGIAVEAVPSYNTDKPMHPKKNGWLGYIITACGTRIYIGGDMDATSEAAGVQCGIAMLPIGGTYTMNPEEAAALVNKMKPEIVIPTHYGTLAGDPGDGQRFASLVDDGIRVEFKL